MIKKHEFNYVGMSKDSSRDLQNPKYFDAQNIRITALNNKTQMAITNELGNELIFSIPTPVLDFVGTRIKYDVGVQTKAVPYVAAAPSHPRCEIESQFMVDANTAKTSGDQVIIGVKELRDSAIIITTDNNGFDCIWEVTGLNESSFDIDLLYMANLGLSTDNLINIIYNYENSIIQKIYFVDGKHQIRYINIKQSVDNGDSINLIDLSPSLLDIVSTFTLQQPDIIGVVGGGSHTAGKIQYAYGLYILNGAQTVTSPLSELVPIDKGQNLGGGDVNEELGRSVLIKVTDIDPKFTHIKIYAIKYTSYNELPQITIVTEREIDNFTEFNYTDDGTSTEEISLEAFQFLGSSPIVPEHIVTKDNRLFPINIKEKGFDVDLDTRSFSFGPVAGTQQVSQFWMYGDNDVDANGNIVIQVDGTVYNVPVTIGMTPVQVATEIKNYLDVNLVGYETVSLSSIETRRVLITTTRTATGPTLGSAIIETQLIMSFGASTIFGTDPNPGCIVLNNAFYNGEDDEVQGEEATVTSPDFALMESHDAINRDYEIYKYKSDGATLGASGKYIDIEFTQTQYNTVDEAEDLELLKSDEIYRLGIKFYNRRGQSTNPKWVMDFRAPKGNLNGLHTEVNASLTAEFYTWLNDSSNFDSQDDKPVGYKILRADRTLQDQTIFSQGIINPMVANYVHEDKFTTLEDRKNAVISTASDILPSQIRKFKTERPIVACKNYHELAWKSLDSDTTSAETVGGYTIQLTPLTKLSWGQGAERETWSSGHGSEYRAQTFQFTSMMQFFSPDVLFRSVDIDAGYKLKVVGLIKERNTFNWSTEENPLTSSVRIQAKYVGGITRGTGVGATEVLGDEAGLSDYGFFGPTNDTTNIATQQTYREFDELFEAKGDLSMITHEVYGSPELTNEGSDYKNYNGNPSLRYANHIKNMLQDKFGEDANNDASNQVIGVNSNGVKCVTFALGPDDNAYPMENRTTIEQVYDRAKIYGGESDGVLLTEFVRDDYISYVGGIYGGTSYEAKRNTEYIEIGSYADINESVSITSPGDTFVNNFTFTKIAKDELQNTTQSQNLACEIVSFTCETTIDLKNRKDLSSGSWDSRAQPKHEEYANYNQVYSQQPILTKVSDLGFKFKKVQEFDGRITSTKLKVPGEFVDSWTDLLENETMDLDGQYGPINAVVTLNDEIFCLQDTAVAHLAINPRVQVPGDDGIALELGTGGILHDYKYLSSTIGCLNKFGVIATESTFYFVDLINRGIMAFNKGSISRFSDLKGFHHTFLNDMNYDALIKDNPVLGTGVSLGYNPSSADVYFSFRQNVFTAAKNAAPSFTIGFNEAAGEFTSYYSYIPAWYINKGSTLISSGPDSKDVWQHLTGTPNEFYGIKHPSSLTLHIAPEGNEIILNSASYKLEVTDSTGKDLPTKGLTDVEVYNDYQTSGQVALQIRKNAFKKFRNWKITLPRERGKRERIRSAWGFVKFTFDNPDGNNLVLHNISIFYTQH